MTAEHESEKEVKKKLTETISLLQEVIQGYDEKYTPILLSDSLNVADLREAIRNLEALIRKYEDLVE